MKFFSNLPKTSFASDIGNFTISDFFTFIDVENNILNKTVVTIDNKSTLIEASYNLYSDANNIWVFLLANKNINPFDLLEENSVLFEQENENKINFLLFDNAGSTTNGSAFPVGSLVFPYIANTGGTASYGSTGNFDFNGPFARIQNMSFYDGNMTIGKQFGGTGDFITVEGTTTDRVVVLSLNSGGTYSWGGVYYTSNKISAPDVVVYVQDIEESQTIYKGSTGYNPTVDELLDTTAVMAFAQQTTAKTVIDNSSKTINAYENAALGGLRASFITAKYI